MDSTKNLWQKMKIAVRGNMDRTRIAQFAQIRAAVSAFWKSPTAPVVVSRSSAIIRGALVRLVDIEQMKESFQ